MIPCRDGPTLFTPGWMVWQVWHWTKTALPATGSPEIWLPDASLMSSLMAPAAGGVAAAGAAAVSAAGAAGVVVGAAGAAAGEAVEALVSGGGALVLDLEQPARPAMTIAPTPKT